MLRTTMRGLGEVFITLGVVILLFVVFQLYWTGVLADQARADELDKLAEQRKLITSGQSSQPVASTPGKPTKYVDGQPFGEMLVPRFGADWSWTIRPGVGKTDLQKGLGWYKGSAQAGEDGNFAVAGHRKTYGDPLRNVPRLRAGDKIVIRGLTEWFVYSVDQPLILNGTDGAVYRTVPEDVHVLDPVPQKAYKEAGKYITLTTCDPEFGSTHRLIVWGHLELRTPLSAGEPVALRQ